MVDVLVAIYELIIEGFNFIVDCIWTFFSEMGSIIVEAIRWFFRTFYGWAFGGVSTLLNEVFSSVEVPYSLRFAAEIYTTINYFVPLNELLIISGLVFLTWFTYFIVKVILKIIPTIY